MAAIQMVASRKRGQRMDTGKLKEFVTLVECGGFRTASQKLFISQSTLSRHITDLETQAERMLIVRSNPVTLTPSGIVFEQYARRLIALCDQFEKDLLSMRDDAPYRIMVQDVSSDRHLSELFASINSMLKDHLIGAHFEFVPLPSASVVDAVTSHMIDIGVIEAFTHGDEMLMQDSDDVDFVMLPATRQPLFALCSRSSPFGTHASVDPRDLASMRLLASGALSPVDTGLSMELLAARLSEKSGCAPSFSVLDLPIEKILAMVKDDAIILTSALGAALLPHDFHASHSLKLGGLKDYQTAVCLVMRKNWKELAERMRETYHLF